VTKTGGRKQQKDDTRHRLFAAAAALFSECGYAGTTVAAIARRAGVAKGTFFVHFASKDAVAVELVRLQVGAARRARVRAIEAGGSPLEALRISVLTLGEQAGQSRALSRAVLAATLENQETGSEADAIFGEIYAEMIADARAARRAGLIGPHPDPKTLAASLMASYLGAALHFTSSPRPQPLIEILRPLVLATLPAARRSTSEEVAHVEKTRARIPRARRR
jgi:AcrR family transcriptional regulator